ncbi:MAG: hypothetical protein JO270_03435 [Acidobacteriaceae bacterium]|nr:hypothetical protein [Acidobacteriaceae bacterium]
MSPPRRAVKGGSPDVFRMVGSPERTAMKDMHVQLERLLNEASECVQ